MSATKSTPQRARNKYHIIDDNALQALAKDEVVDDDDLLEDVDYDEDTYKPRPQLPTPFVFMRTLEHLMNDLDNEILDIDPEYQREVVWTADRMTGLINSLMESFYIPPIIINKKPQEAHDGGKARSTLVCVDGKQRLSSVRAFIKGMIPCHDHRGEKWWFCNTNTIQRKKILPDETQKMFLSKEFVTFEFSDLSAEQEEDLFARVQMGVQLSAAEKMRASSGPWQELAKLFVTDFPIVYSLMKDRARAKDFQLTLACFSQIIEVMHPAAANGVPTLKTSHGSLPKLLSNKEAVNDGLKSHLASVWNTLKDLIEEDPDTFTNDNKYLRGVQTFAPIEMVAVTVLISVYSDTRSIQLLLGDIKALRITLREHFTDLRLNIHLWRFLWDFIGDLEAIRGAVDGTTNQKRLGQPLKPLLPNSFAPLPASTVPSAITPARIAELPPRKAPSILPRFDSVPIKEEDKPPDSRPRKRQRTDPSPVNSPSPIIASTMRQNTHSLPYQPAPAFTTPNSTTFSLQAAQNFSIVPRNNPGLATRTPPSREPEDHKPAVVPPLGSISTAKSRPSLSTSQSQPIQASKPQEYRATFATMFPSLPGEVSTQLASRSPAGVPFQSGQASFAPASRQTPHSRVTNPTQQTAIGASTSNYTGKQWAGVETWIPTSILSGAAPALSSVPMTGLPAKPPLSTNTPRSTSMAGLPPKPPRRTPVRPTPAEYDGAIDLTNDSDAEEQRQTPLSSFKGRSPQGKQNQSFTAAPSASSASTSFAQAQQHGPTPNTQAGELPEAFNLYAKFLEKQ